MAILVINGPNLNLLGTREPGVYGSETLADVTSALQARADALGVQVSFFQSNHEGAIVDAIQQAAHTGIRAVVINAGAYTHTSVAIRDAFSSVAIPFVEVHISNVHQREPFRHHSYLADKAVAVVAGLGTYGYHAALEFCVQKFCGPK